MSKALAVQSARVRTAGLATSSAKAGAFKSIVAKKLHTSAERKANVDTTTTFKKTDPGELLRQVRNLWLTMFNSVSFCPKSSTGTN